MKERGILFSGAMVRALLSGTKTQTRRVVTLPKERGEWEPSTLGGPHARLADGTTVAEFPCIWNTTTGTSLACPYGAPGDQLWVRETWCSAYARGCWGTVFAADEAFIQGKRAHEKGAHFNAESKDQTYRWKPSIHLPRWASRITLEVTEVRVQRLQDISEEDAAAEGVAGWSCNNPITAREGYRALWDSINGDRAPWSANPWAWAVSFLRVQP
jgi:hypothetical protein